MNLNEYRKTLWVTADKLRSKYGRGGKNELLREALAAWEQQRGL